MGGEFMASWTGTPGEAFAFGALSAVTIMFLLALLIVLYVYSAYTLMIIAKKTKTKRPWLAWIPIANFYLVVKCANLNGWWTLILLASIIDWMGLGMLVIWGFSIWFFWLICERRKYPGPLSLLMLIPGLGHLIVLGILAWGKK